jgi:hypothetical protein
MGNCIYATLVLTILSPSGFPAARPFLLVSDGILLARPAEHLGFRTTCGVTFIERKLVDEVFCIIGFVSAKRERCRPVGTRLDHVQPGHPLGMPSACVRQTSTSRPWWFSISPCR